MDSNLKNITILVPTYNRLEYLEKLLDTIPSTANVIVGDNGAYIPEQFKQKYPSFVFHSRPETLEALENWNKCIEMVETEWFVIPSDDDLYYENSFDIIGKSIQQYQDFDVIIFGHNVIDKNGTITSSWKPAELKTFTPPFGYQIFKYGVDARFPSMIFKKKIVVENGLFDTSYKITAGDSKLIQRCLLKGKIAFIPALAGAYRTWEQNSTTLTRSTIGWFNEIDRWQKEILPEAINAFASTKKKIKTGNIRDEVFARSLIASLRAKREIGIVDSLKFASKVRYPWQANFRTHLQIFKAIVIG